MILPWLAALLATPAHATDPADPPVSAVAVRCARAVDVPAGYPWAWSADRPTLPRLTALVVTADADLLRRRDVGQRVLYAEGWPVEVLAVEGDTALVLAPFAPPGGPIRAWFGDETLPERVDAPHRAAMATAAAPLSPLPLPPVAGALVVPPEAAAPRTLLATTLTAWWREGCPG